MLIYLQRKRKHFQSKRYVNQHAYIHARIHTLTYNTSTIYKYCLSGTAKKQNQFQFLIDCWKTWNDYKFPIYGHAPNRFVQSKQIIFPLVSIKITHFPPCLCRGPLFLSLSVFICWKTALNLGGDLYVHMCSLIHIA